MTRYVGLLRGVNVGPSKRIAMSDLKAIVESIGGRDVTTILNSGNVVFSSKSPTAASLAKKIQDGIQKTCGFSANTLVLSAAELSAILDDDPVGTANTNDSRYIVALVMDSKVLSATRAMSKQNWGTERCCITKRAAYFWCPDGLLASQSVEAFARIGKDAITMRNWATLKKIQAAAADH